MLEVVEEATFGMRIQQVNPLCLNVCEVLEYFFKLVVQLMFLFLLVNILGE